MDDEEEYGEEETQQDDVQEKYDLRGLVVAKDALPVQELTSNKVESNDSNLKFDLRKIIELKNFLDGISLIQSDDIRTR